MFLQFWVIIINHITIQINLSFFGKITIIHSFHDDYTLKQLVMMSSFHNIHECHLQESDLYCFLMVMFLALFCIWFTNMINEPKSIIERLLVCILKNKNKLTKCNLIRNRRIHRLLWMCYRFLFDYRLNKKKEFHPTHSENCAQYFIRFTKKFALTRACC